MGLYVEPKDMSKPAWCYTHRVLRVDNIYDIDFDVVTLKGHMLVCLVNNGHFHAIGVAFDNMEFERFKMDDSRYKEWFIVPKNVVKADAPMWELYMGKSKPKWLDLAKDIGKIILSVAARVLIIAAIVYLFILFTIEYKDSIAGELSAIFLGFLLLNGLDKLLLDHSPTWRKWR